MLKERYEFIPSMYGILAKVYHDKTLPLERVCIWGVHSVKSALEAKRPVYELLYTPSKKEQFGCFGRRSCINSFIEHVIPKDVVTSECCITV